MARTVADVGDLHASARGPIQELLAGSQQILSDALVGVVLHGSLTTGDYVPGRSDIDLLVVVSEPLGTASRAQLKELAATTARDHRTRLDYRVVTTDVAGRPTLAPTVDLYVGVHTDDPSDIEILESEPEPDLVVEFSICRQVGRSLFGPSPADLIGPVPRELVLRVGDGYLQRWQAIGDDPPYADLTVVTACRLWHFATTGEHASKRHAVEWVAVRAEGAALHAAKLALARREGRSTADYVPSDVAAVLDATRGVIASARTGAA